jgi:hypothetical protein
MSTDKSLNPFVLGGVVTGRQFAGRTVEIARLRDIVGTGQHAYVYAPRRYGKSSLLREAFGALIDAKRVEGVWCDCWPAADAQDLATRLARDVVDRAGSLNKVAEWVKTAGSLFKRLRPTYRSGRAEPACPSKSSHRTRTAPRSRRRGGRRRSPRRTPEAPDRLGAGRIPAGGPTE